MQQDNELYTNDPWENSMLIEQQEIQEAHDRVHDRYALVFWVVLSLGVLVATFITN